MPVGNLKQHLQYLVLMECLFYPHNNSAVEFPYTEAKLSYTDDTHSVACDVFFSMYPWFLTILFALIS